MGEYKLLNVGRNVKTLKSDKKGEYLTGILYLAPGKLSGIEVCPNRTPGCYSNCLYWAGYGALDHVQESRKGKTRRFFEDKRQFMVDLVSDIRKLQDTARNLGLKPVVRLNGTSDLKWEYIPVEIYGHVIPNIFTAFNTVQFYDYTKIPGRKTPDNYHLTYSLAETWESEDAAIEYLESGHNISVVFRKELPEDFWGYTVVDGDDDDLRFLDMNPVVVGLKAKGHKTKKDKSGFVYDVEVCASTQPRRKINE